MPSPAHKRPNRARQPARAAKGKDKAASNVDDDAPVRTQPAARRGARAGPSVAAAKPPPKLRAPASRTDAKGKKGMPPPVSEHSEDEQEQEDEGSGASDASITARMSRSRRTRASPPLVEDNLLSSES